MLSKDAVWTQQSACVLQIAAGPNDDWGQAGKVLLTCCRGEYLCIDASSLCNSESVAVGGTVRASNKEAPPCIAACLAAYTLGSSQTQMQSPNTTQSCSVLFAVTGLWYFRQCSPHKATVASVQETTEGTFSETVHVLHVQHAKCLWDDLTHPE